MIFVKEFTLPDFHSKNFTPQKCVICTIDHALYIKSANAFEITNLAILLELS